MRLPPVRNGHLAAASALLLILSATVVNLIPRGSLLLGQVTSCTIRFNKTSEILTGSQPVGLNLGNPDGNSVPDFFVASPGQQMTWAQGLVNPPSTFLNFAAPGFTPGMITHGDVEGDGRQDVIIAGQDSSGPYPVRIFRGRGNGVFDPPVRVTVNGTGVAGRVILQDLIGDGWPDLLLAGNGIFLVPGQGLSNGFLPSVQLPGQGAGGLATADFNGDGLQDIAAAGSTEVSVLIATAKGVYPDAQSYGQGSYPQGLTIADLNRDGTMDIISPTQGGTTSVIVLLGRGDGTFDSAAPLSLGNGRSPGIADIDGNGTLDLVISTGGNFSVLPGRGDGTFGEETVIWLNPGSDLYDLVVYDFSRDGRPDVAVADRNGGTNGSVSIFTNGTTCSPVSSTGGGTQSSDETESSAAAASQSSTSTGPSVCTPVCGDRLIVGNEQCDDGNTVSGDGCSATCRNESSASSHSVSSRSSSSRSSGNSRSGSSGSSSRMSSASNRSGSSRSSSRQSNGSSRSGSSAFSTGSSRSASSRSDSSGSRASGASSGRSGSASSRSGSSASGMGSSRSASSAGSARSGSSQSVSSYSSAGSSRSASSAASTVSASSRSISSRSASSTVSLSSRSMSSTSSMGSSRSASSAGSAISASSRSVSSTASAGSSRSAGSDASAVSASSRGMSSRFSSAVRSVSSARSVASGGGGSGGGASAGQSSRGSSRVVPVCGNARLEQGENCEDGNTKNGDGCDAKCQLEAGFPPVCGDGIIMAPEQCDDGNAAGGDGCSDRCMGESGTGCYRSTDCGSNLCIDGVCQACGDAAFCPATLRCMNGVCVPFPASCGNGRREGDEVCDDSNAADGDGCSSDCILEEDLPLLCGDGIVMETEECDDGNELRGDGCAPDCLAESGFCGDGTVQRLLGEQCEPMSFDASVPYQCSADCRFVSFFCGDGVLDSGEQCDDGGANADWPDHCRLDCSVPRCGDGIRDEEEQCDDGNRTLGDGCDHLCREEKAAAPGSPDLSASIIDLPFTDDGTGGPHPSDGRATDIAISHPPAGNTGPAVIVLMSAVAAAGYAWARRRKKMRS